MNTRTLCFALPALCLFPSLAWADAQAPVSWWVETRPWTCVARTQPLAQHLQLACDASGGCTVAPSRTKAQRNAVLVCGEDGWTLEAESAAGERLWTLSLGSSDDEERLQRAAMWIARSEGTSTLSGPGLVAASEPVPMPKAQASAQPPSRAPEADREPSRSKDEPSVALALMGRGSRDLAAQYFREAAGGGAMIMGRAPRIAGPVSFGVAVSAEIDGATSRLYRGGVAVGLGAPFDDHVLGVSVEGGPASLTLVTGQKFGGYGQASLYAQVPGGKLRPFLAANVGAAMVQPATTPAFIGLELGLVWGQHGDAR